MPARFQRSKRFKFATRTAGNISVTSTTFATVHTSLDLTLPAAVGDVIEYGVSLLTGGENYVIIFDVATVVGGSPVNFFSGGTAAGGDGIVGWGRWTNALTGSAGSAMYQVVAGDLSNGLVTCRLMSRIQSAGARTIYAQPGDVLHVWAKNIGPQYGS